MTPEQASTRIGECFNSAQIEGGAPLVVTLSVEQWVAFAQFAKDDLRCRFFSFLTAVDWKDLGLEVVAKIDNVDDNLSLMMKTRLGPGYLSVPVADATVPRRQLDGARSVRYVRHSFRGPS